MSYLYVCEQGARISFEENRFDVRYKGAVLQSIPAEMLEVIEGFGKVQHMSMSDGRESRRILNAMKSSSLILQRKS